MSQAICPCRGEADSASAGESQSTLRVLIFGHLGQGNIGDELMLRPIVAALRQRFPKARLTVLAGSLYDREFCTAEQIRRLPRTFGHLLRALLQHDLLVVAGGTHLHTRRTTSRYSKGVLRHLAVYTLARVAGLRVWLVGVGIGPFETRIGCLLGRGAVRAADFISVRDRESLEWLKRWNVRDGQFHLCLDPVCYLPLPARLCTTPHLGISVMSYFRLYSKAAREDEILARRFHDVMQEWFRVFPNSRISLVAFYSGDDPASDVLFAQRMKAMWAGDSRVLVVDPHGAIDCCIECFRHFTHFVGMRYHSQVLAALYGIPQIVIAYHSKNQGFAAACGIRSEDIISVEDFAGGRACTAMIRLFRGEVIAPTVPVSGRLDELLPLGGSSG